MNKLLIGLLVVAAGAGVYFFLLKKKKLADKPETKKEWIIGSWNAQNEVDSNGLSGRFEFRTDGLVLRAVNDSSKADTTYYSWTKTGALMFKNTAEDSTGKEYPVISLTTDSLRVKTGDSSTVLLTKLK